MGTEMGDRNGNEQDTQIAGGGFAIERAAGAFEWDAGARGAANSLAVLERTGRQGTPFTKAVEVGNQALTSLGEALSSIPLVCGNPFEIVSEWIV